MSTRQLRQFLADHVDQPRWSARASLAVEPPRDSSARVSFDARLITEACRRTSVSTRSALPGRIARIDRHKRLADRERLAMCLERFGDAGQS